jgi:hypothetical protein
MILAATRVRVSREEWQSCRGQDHHRARRRDAAAGSDHEARRGEAVGVQHIGSPDGFTVTGRIQHGVHPEACAAPASRTSAAAWPAPDRRARGNTARPLHPITKPVVAQLPQICPPHHRRASCVPYHSLAYVAMCSAALTLPLPQGKRPAVVSK